MQMHEKKYILFDLDGTLTDSGHGIINSVLYALKQYGIDEDPAMLTRFIGPPLAQSFQKYYGFSELQAFEAIEFYREYYGEKGVFENKAYDGILPLIKNLFVHGKSLIVATSKPTYYAAKVVEHFGLLPYFSFIAGSKMDNTRTDKAEVIAYAIEKNANFAVEAAIMVGDRNHDIIGAQKNGMASIGVTYGYGSEAELLASGADYVVHSPLALQKLLLYNKHLEDNA